MSGFEVEWNYYDLMVSYGIYDNTGRLTAKSSRPRPSVSNYTVAF